MQISKHFFTNLLLIIGWFVSYLILVSSYSIINKDQKPIYIIFLLLIFPLFLQWINFWKRLLIYSNLLPLFYIHYIMLISPSITIKKFLDTWPSLYWWQWLSVISIALMILFSTSYWLSDSEKKRREYAEYIITTSIFADCENHKMSKNLLSKILKEYLIREMKKRLLFWGKVLDEK